MWFAFSSRMTAMADTKELTWDETAERADERPDEDAEERVEDAPAERWDAYRNWLSRAPAPATRLRPTFDASVYTWKGYRSWSDKVKRSWSDRNEQD